MGGDSLVGRPPVMKAVKLRWAYKKGAVRLDVTIAHRPPNHSIL